MGAPRAPYMAKTDKERLATGFWNRIESNQATDCNILCCKAPRKSHKANVGGVLRAMTCGPFGALLVGRGTVDLRYQCVPHVIRQ